MLYVLYFKRTNKYNRWIEQKVNEEDFMHKRWMSDGTYELIHHLMD